MPLTTTNNSAMTKDEVTAVQIQLNKAGFNPGAIDGVMGPHTESAIIAFKRAHNLKPRAFVGPMTWDLLMQGTLPLSKEPTDELPWIAWGRRLIGLHEIYDNAELRRILAEDRHALGDPAKLPWCGDFVETAIKLNLPNEPFTGALAKNPYWALNWLKFGIPCRPTYGAVAAIRRSGGGHVMFIVGEDATRYYCLGGNQGNKVSIVPVDKRRFKSSSFRWPSTYHVQPGNHLPHMNSAAAANTQES